jgi:hypothetical protein
MRWSFPSWRIASVGNHGDRINGIISRFAFPGNTHVVGRAAMRPRNAFARFWEGEASRRAVAIEWPDFCSDLSHAACHANPHFG